MDVWVAEPKKKWAYRTGTSFAVPYALATAALLLKDNPRMSRDVLFEALKSKASDLGKPGYDSIYGYGLIQATACR